MPLEYSPTAQQSEADVFVAQAILAYEDKRYEEALGYLRRVAETDLDTPDERPLE